MYFSGIRVPHRTRRLHLAVERGHLESVRFLLGMGAEVNHTDAEGEAPLALACGHHNMEMAQLLVEGGADVNARGRNGETCLARACKSDHSR